MRNKVAIIDPLGAHGSSHHLYLFGQIIGLMKHNVSVSLYTNNETKNIYVEKLRFYRFYRNIFKSKYKIISGLRWILGTIVSVFHARFSGSSIFHFHLFSPNSLILFNIVLAKIVFGKVVVTVHDVYSFSATRSNSLIIKIIYALTDLVLTHNEFSRLEISKNNSKLQSSIQVIAHGNYLPFISVENDIELSRKHLNLPLGKTILLFFGMIKEVKGLDILLEALKQVIAKNKNVILLIAGKPWKVNFSIYQDLIDSNGLTQHCILHKRFIPHQDVQHYYCASDLVVLPYKRIYQSGVLMMSLSYCKAVLVSDLPPLKEIIIDNKNGFIFKSEDADDLSKRIKEILLEPELLELVSEEGGKLIRDQYSWDQVGLLTKKSYESII